MNLRFNIEFKAIYINIKSINNTFEKFIWDFD